MKILIKLAVIGLLVMGASLLYSLTPALACSTTTAPIVASGEPTPTPILTPIPPSIAARTKSVSVVLEAEILQVSGVYPATITIKVSRYFKGSGPEFIVMNDFFGVDCRPNVRIGEHSLFFANGVPSLNLYPYTQIGNADRAEPNEINIAEIIAATGQQPTLPTDVTPTATLPITTPTIPAPIPTPAPISTPQSENSNNMWLWVGLGAVVVIGGGALLLRKRRR